MKTSFGDNVKVHYVYDGDADTLALDLANVKYRLFSVYKFIKSKDPNSDFRLKNHKWLFESTQNCRHIIQDSGLFTMMFGSDRHKKVSHKDLENWQEKMIQFTRQNNLNVTVVECDCQKLAGVDLAWELRRKLKKQLPNNRILNVFHLEDGKQELDRLIDFSEYLAIPVPELRIHRKGTYKKEVHTLAKYIKMRKPSIDIHLLGCTETNMLKQNRFCSSSDSSSWLSMVRYGYIEGRHSNSIKKERFDEAIKEVECEIEKKGLLFGGVMKKWIAMNMISARRTRDKYEQAAGDQS